MAGMKLIENLKYSDIYKEVLDQVLIRTIIQKGKRVHKALPKMEKNLANFVISVLS
jgi:hypothetical protein